MQARSRFGPLVDRSGRDARRHGGCGQGVDQDAGGCSSSIGADEAAQELSLMQIAAVWHACHALQTQFATRRAKMEEDPSKVPGTSWCMGWSHTTQHRRSEPDQTRFRRRRGSLELQKIFLLFPRQMNLIRSRMFTLF